MQKTILYIFIFPMLSFVLKAQVSSGGQPFSFYDKKDTKLNADVPVEVMPKIDVTQLMAEDEINELNNTDTTGMRFGAEIPVAIDLNSKGLWETLENGDRIWRLQIYAKKAYHLNLIYNNFYLPEGANLFLYNPDKTHQLGAFTSFNNKVHGKFSTGFIQGENTILELYEPAAVCGNSRLSIAKVIYAYRNLLNNENSLQKGFGDSGPCHIDINCPEGDDWQKEKKAVALVIKGNQVKCSGTMLNNQTEDCTPYFLTAHHCVPNNNFSSVNTWLFVFNYESENCGDGIDGTYEQSVSGAEYIAGFETSDFALLELSLPPPPDYEVWMSGWSALKEPANSVVAIHHPKGDVKKISFDSSPVISGDGLSNTPDTHWIVKNWDAGSTENVSSGCGFFNPDHLLVGQLHGGPASCDSLGFDSFGKFSYSWNTGLKNTLRLKDWLDPNDTGIMEIEGRFCVEESPETDVEVSYIDMPAHLCKTDSVFPVIQIKNRGTDTVFQTKIEYGIAGNIPKIYLSNDTLSYWQKKVIALPGIPTSIGSYIMEVKLNEVNQQTDPISFNNEKQKAFEVINSEASILVQIKTDNYGDETSWLVRDENKKIIFSGTGLNNNTDYEWELCVNADACYHFNILDSYGDGICCTSGTGSYQVKLSDGSIVAKGAVFGYEESTLFCIDENGEALLTTAFEEDTTIVCAGESIGFRSLSSGSNSLLWLFEGGIPDSSTQKNPFVLYPDTGKFSVKLYADNGIKTDSLIKEDYIRVLPLPEIEITTTNASAPDTEDGSVSINVLSGIAPIHYYWSNDAADEAKQLSIMAGDYLVTVEDGNGCSIFKTFSIESDIPRLIPKFSSNQTEICEGTSIAFTDESQGSPFQWNWTFEGGQPESSTEQNPVVFYPNAGNFDVQLSVTDEYGTETKIMEGYVKVGIMPQISLEIMPAILHQNNGSATAVTLAGELPLTFEWDNGETGPFAQALSTGEHSVTVTGNNSCQIIETLYIDAAFDSPLNILVYPDISKGLLNVYNNNDSGVQAIILYNTLGQIILSYQKLAYGTHEFQYSNWNLSPGIYLVEVRNEGERFVHKVLLVR